MALVTFPLVEKHRAPLLSALNTALDFHVVAIEKVVVVNLSTHVG